MRSDSPANRFAKSLPGHYRGRRMGGVVDFRLQLLGLKLQSFHERLLRKYSRRDKYAWFHLQYLQAIRRGKLDPANRTQRYNFFIQIYNRIFFPQSRGRAAGNLPRDPSDDIFGHRYVTPSRGGTDERLPGISLSGGRDPGRSPMFTGRREPAAVNHFPPRFAGVFDLRFAPRDLHYLVWLSEFFTTTAGVEPQGPQLDLKNPIFYRRADRRFHFTDIRRLHRADFPAVGFKGSDSDGVMRESRPDNTPTNP